jgi:hypothetical protein
VSPSDETSTMLATKRPDSRPRRSVKASDFALPKPYRKKQFVEDKPEVPKKRIAAASVAGVLVAGLVAVLVLLVKENLATPPVLVVAAPPPADAPKAATPVKLTARTAKPLRAPAPAPVLAHAQAIAAVRTRVDFIPAVLVGGHFVPVASKAARVVHAAPIAQSVEPDPDVVLISTILMLTPPTEPEQGNLACTAAEAKGCTAIHGMVP